MAFSLATAQAGLASAYEGVLRDATGGAWDLYLLSKAVICVESAWNPNAVRNEPAIGDASRGLMQILHGTAQGLGYAGTPDGLFDPQTNITYGVAYLRYQLTRYGNVAAAASAYNGGHALTLASGGYANQAYVDAVLTYYTWYQNNQPGLPPGGSGGLPGPLPVTPPGTPSTAIGTDPGTGALTDTATGTPIAGATDAFTGQAVDLANVAADPAAGVMVDVSSGDPVVLTYPDPQTGTLVPILAPASGVAGAFPFALALLILGGVVLLSSRR